MTPLLRLTSLFTGKLRILFGMSHIPFRHQLIKSDLNSRSPRVFNNDVESFAQLCTSMHLPQFHCRHSSWHSQSVRCAVHNFTQAFLWIMVDKDGSIYVFLYGDRGIKVCQGGVCSTRPRINRVLQSSHLRHARFALQSLVGCS